MRYPENKDEYKGVFAYDFFSLTEMQVGNTEGKLRAHVTYKYLRSVNVETGDTIDILPENTVYDGGQFDTTLSDFHFSKCKLEAQIDMSKCEATASGGGNMETLLSFGKDVSIWKEAVTDLHIYGFRKDGKSYIRVQPMDKGYSDGAYKSGGQENPIVIGEDNLVTIVISSGSILINNVDCMPRNTYADPENHVPIIPYVASKAGQVVQFKCDSVGNLLLDKNKKYIIASEGELSRPDTVTNSFLYSGDDLKDDEKAVVMPLFLTSRFQKSAQSSRNEGTWLLWSKKNTDSNKYGTVGVFGDRALPYSDYKDIDEVLDYSRWFFEPVGDGKQNLYRMYLEATDLETIDDVNDKSTVHEGTHKFYLQATDSYVYGNNRNPYTGNPEFVDHTNAEALCDLPSGDREADAYWKVISLADYYQLFDNPASEFSSMLDLSFLLSDPNFIAENARLSDWKMDDGLKSKVRIGYDQYSKKSTSDDQYTDDSSKTGTDEYNLGQKIKINHGRYMGVDVRGKASGHFYQEVTVRNPGWYAISCGGMSDAGAVLFIQMVYKNGSASTAAESPLHVFEKGEREWYESTENKGWPYDIYNDAEGMPMYNALVAINDENATNGYKQMSGTELTARYNCQKAFFVDPNVLYNNGGTLTLRFGIHIPESSTSTNGWTVFDDFHLSFGGYALEPNLILDEDFTDLNYINNTLHVFTTRPMRLHRTFTSGQWNTIVLPVNLSKGDFQTLFGQKAQLAQLDHLTQNTVEFVSAQEQDDVYLKAFKPYIIRVEGGDKQSKVDTIYHAQYAARETEGKTTYAVSVPADHFYLESATLQGYKTDESKQTYYDFTEKDYVRADDVLAEGGGNKPLRAYGTLCKTYVKGDGGKNTILPDRPRLTGAYVMYGGDMREIGTQYGTKGFRCWFMPEEEGGGNANLSAVKVVVDGETTATGIGDLVDADGGVFIGRYADGVYTLSGQKVRHGTSLESLPAGIYIVNGVKYAVK